MHAEQQTASEQPVSYSFLFWQIAMSVNTGTNAEGNNNPMAGQTELSDASLRAIIDGVTSKLQEAEAEVAARAAAGQRTNSDGKEM